MTTLLKMPLDVYLHFIDRCAMRSREYAVLENAIVEPGQDGSTLTAQVSCDAADARLLLQRAKLFYPKALPYVRQNFPERELDNIATAYRREPASQTWHFCSNCSQWPSGLNFIVAKNYPDDYAVCNECIAMNQRGECH